MIFLFKEAEAWFEFSVEQESDSGLSGFWKESDDEMTPMRRVLFIPAHKFDDIIEKVEQEVSVLAGKLSQIRL